VASKGRRRGDPLHCYPGSISSFKARQASRVTAGAGVNYKCARFIRHTWRCEQKLAGTGDEWASFNSPKAPPATPVFNFVDSGNEVAIFVAITDRRAFAKLTGRDAERTSAAGRFTADDKNILT
jgi:hypothetical protein